MDQPSLYHFLVCEIEWFNFSPQDEREAGDGAEHTPEGVVSEGVVLREKKLKRPTTLLNRLSVQSVNSVVSDCSIDLDNISDDDEPEPETAQNVPKKSGE